MDINWTYCGDHTTVCTHMELSCCTPETTMLNVSYIWILKKRVLNFNLRWEKIKMHFSSHPDRWTPWNLNPRLRRPVLKRHTQRRILEIWQINTKGKCLTDVWIHFLTILGMWQRDPAGKQPPLYPESILGHWTQAMMKLTAQDLQSHCVDALCPLQFLAAQTTSLSFDLQELQRTSPRGARCPFWERLTAEEVRECSSRA